MRYKSGPSFLVAAFLILAASDASAAPPSSCARRFVGTWVYPGGTTVVAPGGIAYPKCPMCVPTQTWTCEGNTYLFSNSGPPGQFSATLSPDGRQLIGSGTVATRVGGAPRVRVETPRVQTPTIGATAPSVQAPAINVTEPSVRGDQAPNVRAKAPRVKTPTITGTEPAVPAPSGRW